SHEEADQSKTESKDPCRSGDGRACGCDGVRHPVYGSSNGNGFFEPEPGAFRCPYFWYRLDGERYAFSDSCRAFLKYPDRTSDRRYQRGGGASYRYRSGGPWQEGRRLHLLVYRSGHGNSAYPSGHADFHCLRPGLYRGGGRSGTDPLAVACESYKGRDRKSTRLNSSHVSISYAVFCLKKKKTKEMRGCSGVQHVKTGRKAASCMR